MTFSLIFAVAAISFPETSCDSWLASMYGKLPFADYTLVSRAKRMIVRRAPRLSPGWSSAFILSFELDWNTPRTEEIPVW